MKCGWGRGALNKYPALGLGTRCHSLGHQPHVTIPILYCHLWKWSERVREGQDYSSYKTCLLLLLLLLPHWNCTVPFPSSSTPSHKLLHMLGVCIFNIKIPLLGACLLGKGWQNMMGIKKREGASTHPPPSLLNAPSKYPLKNEGTLQCEKLGTCSCKKGSPFSTPVKEQ